MKWKHAAEEEKSRFTDDWCTERKIATRREGKRKDKGKMHVI